MEKGLTSEIFPQKRKLDKSDLMDDHDQMLTSLGTVIFLIRISVIFTVFFVKTTR